MIPNVAFTLAVMRITVRTAASFTRTRITLPRTRMRISPLTYTSKVKILYTGIDWNELTSSKAENSYGKNTIKKIALMDPTMLCICGRTGDVRILLCII